jgi:hypothetical protein
MIMELEVCYCVSKSLPLILVELSLSMPRRYIRGVEIQLYSFSTSLLERGELSASLPGCFTPLKNPNTYSMGAWVGPRAGPVIIIIIIIIIII